MAETRITVIRHGETEWNVAMQLQGHQDSPLTKKGREQAELLAEGIKGKTFDKFYTSDLGRAIHTTDTINKYLNMEYETNSKLRERAFGVMEGRTREDIYKTHPEVVDAYNRRDPEFPIPDGESLVQFYARIISELESLTHKHPNEHILIVAHGGVLDCIMRKIFNLKLDDTRCFTIYNSSVNSFTIRGREWLLEEWGNIEHLQKQVVLNESN